MDKLSDDGGKAKGTMIKVKFKGSKLATGSSKMPNALVTSHFMSKLTPLNISIMGGTPAPPAKKQKKSEHTDRFEEDNDRLRRRRVSIAPIATEIQPAPPPQRPGSAETNVPVPLAPRLISRKVGSEMVPLSTKTSEGIAAATQHVVASSSSSSQRDWSVGGICLPAAGPVSTTSSVLHAVKPNRKQFQKMVEAIDPTEMDVTCDFDFWLWLDAQKLFAPFSYKTHDLSVVALQDIGREEVLSRWHFPPLSGGADIVAAASNAGPEVGPSSSCPSSSQTHMSCTNGVHAGRVDSVGCGSGEDASAGVAAAAGTSSPYIPPAVLNGTHNNVCNGRDSVMYNSSSSSSSAGVRRQGWSELNRGVDDSADPSAYVPCFPESSSAISSHSFAALIAEEAHEAALLAGLLSGQPQPHLLGGRASGSNSIGFVGELAALEDDSSQSIDSYLQELSGELLRNNLAVNGVIARLRRDCLQSEELRGELEAHCRQQEREKIIVSKWRKSKSYLATLHSSSNHNQNSRSSGDSNHSNGASSGGNGKGGGTHSKVKSAHHRRKLGTY